MRAMVLEHSGAPLVLRDLPRPKPASGQVQLEILACGICRTDLHVVDGDLANPALPLVLGHEIVGRVTQLGDGVTGLVPGQRVGVPWLGYTCGHCTFCKRQEENLCDEARFTGYQLAGGYAEYTVADARFCFPLAGEVPDAALAPLLCAGLIGYRAYRLAGPAERIGLYGFGAAAHILAQVAVYQGRAVYAFTRPGDAEKQAFAKTLGATWAGDSEAAPPQPLDAAILFAPDGALVPHALRAVRKGGRVVCAGIHMSDIPSFPYSILWEERQIRSVANLTRQDGLDFLALAPQIPVRTSIRTLPLEEANEGLAQLRDGEVHGALVLVP